VPQAPRVLFVSKPIAPPWNDGSKNLVRDVASHLERARPTVMTIPGATSIGARVTMEPVYRDPGRFAPALLANARVLARLTTGDAHDVWQFVFAPNATSSSAARLARDVRRGTGWRGAVVQTIASAPKRFDTVARWIFGDHVVALSEWTRARLIGAGVRSRGLRVIPPCALAPAPTLEQRRAVRARYDLGAGPVVVYPGDYEVSNGALTVARAVREVVRAVPEATVMFVCRAKTQRATPARAQVEAELRALGVEARTRQPGEIDDMHALLAEASVVAFPVDDLYGKVDLPLVLLEALSLGVPLVLASRGPLEAIEAARFVEAGDADSVAREVVRILRHEGEARELSERGRALYAERYAPAVVAAQYDDLYDAVSRGTPV
jgi:glycosyltransferase involved in cell wall biosynthesis